MKQYTTILTPTPPYDFGLTAGYATYFQGRYAAESFQHGVFSRLLDFGDRHSLARVRSVGTVDSPRLEMTLEGDELGSKATSEARRRVKRILGLEQDLAPFYEMASEDSTLRLLTRGLRGLHVPQASSVYEGLALAILGQQISSQVARVLRNRFVRTYGRSAEISAETYHAFPMPEAVVEGGVEGLRGINASTKKAQYIVDVASRLLAGELDLEGLRARPDEEVVGNLTAIRGAGMWTAQWLLIRALGRTDGFPYGDLALRRGLGLLLNHGRPLSPEEALRYSHRWSPFRSYVTTYLFAAMRSDRLPELASR